MTEYQIVSVILTFAFLAFIVFTIVIADEYGDSWESSRIRYKLVTVYFRIVVLSLCLFSVYGIYSLILRMLTAFAS